MRRVDRKLVGPQAHVTALQHLPDPHGQTNSSSIWKAAVAGESKLLAATTTQLPHKMPEPTYADPAAFLYLHELTERFD